MSRFLTFLANYKTLKVPRTLISRALSILELKSILAAQLIITLHLSISSSISSADSPRFSFNKSPCLNDRPHTLVEPSVG